MLSLYLVSIVSNSNGRRIVGRSSIKGIVVVRSFGAAIVLYRRVGGASIEGTRIRIRVVELLAIGISSSLRMLLALTISVSRLIRDYYYIKLPDSAI